MSDLAARLIGQHALNPQSTLPTAVFGTAGTVYHALQMDSTPNRIGLWPIISPDVPEISMGIAVILSYLLECYQGIKVYRVLARVDGQPEDYRWTIEHSQFDVDDWQIDGLDDNVGIWGTLSHQTLTLYIENDTVGTEDESAVTTLTYDYTDLQQLVGHLHQIAGDVAKTLNASELRVLALDYTIEDWDSAALKSMVELCFHWERKLFLALWGQPWTREDITAHAKSILSAGSRLGDLGAWLIGHTLARAINELVEDDLSLSTLIDEVVSTIDNSKLVVLLAEALHQTQRTAEAYSIIEQGREDVLVYLAAAELYRRGGRLADAIDTYQAAIENDLVNARLYRRYAELLIAMDYNNLEVEAVVLVDPDEVPDATVLWEAVEAYQAALELSPEETDVLLQQLLQILELNPEDDRLWPGMERLVQSDDSGEKVRALVDGFHTLADLEPAIKILKKALASSPHRVDLYLNLGAVYILAEDFPAAESLLLKGRALASSPDEIEEIDRMLLSVEDPEFELKLGEIADILNAGNVVSSDAAEFLETILERIPSFAEVSILLARAYLGWDETGSALETLLDGHRHSPDNSEIIALLSETLWDSGQEDLAFNYLNKGLSHNPHNVPLLALAGKFLFEDGQEDAARAYLQKAEALSPRNAVLARVRQHIGRAYFE